MFLSTGFVGAVILEGKDLIVRVLLQGWDTGLSPTTLRGPTSHRHTGTCTQAHHQQAFADVMLFLACLCMTTPPVGVLAELTPEYLVGEQGCIQSKWTPLLSNKKGLFCQINSSDFQLEKRTMNYMCFREISE